MNKNGAREKQNNELIAVIYFFPSQIKTSFRFSYCANLIFPTLKKVASDRKSKERSFWRVKMN